MKGFERNNQYLSLCGLNCGLCPMFLGKHCGGCGNGNQSCKIAKCSLEHGKVEYCFACEQYPCEKYQHFDAYDSFITHRRRKADLDKVRRIGVEAYNLEQQEKQQILQYLLTHYDDGRKKTFYCVAVNLLELSEIKETLSHLKSNDALSALPKKEQCSYVTQCLKEIAEESDVEIKLIRKK